MSKWVFLLITSMLLAFGCREEGPKVSSDLLNFPKTASGESNEDLPAVSFEQAIFNFDTVAVGERVVHSFKFTNTGKAPLIISSVKPACGCTALKDWPQNPIAPGDGGQITVEFNSGGFSGPIEKSVFVRTNTVPVDNVLKITGVVKGVAIEGEAVDPAIKMERTR